MFNFRIYVTGDSLNPARALSNLAALCRTHLPDRHQIEVIDVFKDPECGLMDGIFMTPTLIKLASSPVRRIVCTLSHRQTVLLAQDLESHVP